MGVWILDSTKILNLLFKDSVALFHGSHFVKSPFLPPAGVYTVSKACSILFSKISEGWGGSGNHRESPAKGEASFQAIELDSRLL